MHTYSPLLHINAQPLNTHRRRDDHMSLIFTSFYSQNLKAINCNNESTSNMHPQSLPVFFSFSTSMQSRIPTSSVSEEPYPILYRIQHPLSNEPIPSALHAGGLYCNQEFRHLRHSEEEGREWSRP